MAVLTRRLYLLLCLVWIVPVVAQSDLEIAATAYEKEDYTTAIAAYQSVVAAGVRDGGVFFNLATAYYAAGDNARALLNYLRAADHMPRDSDTQLQIARIRARREDGDMLETDLLTLVGTLTNSWLTLGELDFLTGCIWFVFFALLAIYIRQKSWRERLHQPLILLSSVLVIFLLLLFSRQYIAEIKPAAVITEPFAQVMNGAGENYLPLFRVFNAAEVRILQERGGWLHILLADGRQGWVRTGALETVAIP